MHTEGVLVPFLENHVFIVIFLLKVKMRWASLFDDSLDMVAIFFIKKRGDLCKDGSNISHLANVFSFKKTNYHAWVQTIVDCAGSCLVDSLVGDLCLFGVVKSQQF